MDVDLKCPQDLPLFNVKQVPLPGGQGETAEKGRPFQTGWWQF